MYKETKMYGAMLLAYELGKKQGEEASTLYREHIEEWSALKDKYLEKVDVHTTTETE